MTKTKGAKDLCHHTDHRNSLEEEGRFDSWFKKGQSIMTEFMAVEDMAALSYISTDQKAENRQETRRAGNRRQTGQQRKRQEKKRGQKQGAQKRQQEWMNYQILRFTTLQ